MCVNCKFWSAFQFKFYHILSWRSLPIEDLIKTYWSRGNHFLSHQILDPSPSKSISERCLSMFSFIRFCSISVTTTTARQRTLSIHSPHSTSQRRYIRSESEEFVAESRATVTMKVFAGKKSRTGCNARLFSNRLRFLNLYFPVRLYFYGFRHSCPILVEQASTCDVQPATTV